MTHFLERLLGLTRLRFADGKMICTSLNGTAKFIPVSGEQFRYVPRVKNAPGEPVATAMLLAPNAEGRFASIIGVTMKRIPTWLVFTEAVLAAWFLLAVLSILLYAPFWIFGGLIKKRRRPAERAMRLWPLIAAFSLLAFALLLTLSVSDMITRLGNLTVWSFGLFLTSLLFGLASLASALALWWARKQQIRKTVRWYSIVATTALLIATAYLAWWGVIGIRTWS
jgi:hypothetical protein